MEGVVRWLARSQSWKAVGLGRRMGSVSDGVEEVRATVGGRTSAVGLRAALVIGLGGVDDIVGFLLAGRVVVVFVVVDDG